VYRNNDEYPKCVKLYSVSVGKDIKSREKAMDICEYLEKKEVTKLIQYVPAIQKKATLAIFYGAEFRPEGC
jgi:hypothetical protein